MMIQNKILYVSLILIITWVGSIPGHYRLDKFSDLIAFDSPLQATDQAILSQHSVSTDLRPALSYPVDPSTEISWSAGFAGVADVQSAFNNARTAENSQLGTSIPMMTLPGQAVWNAMSDGQKALWLINRERIDRGVAPLEDVEANVTGVAQYYANFMLANNTWGHSTDGRSPWERLGDNPAIGACHDSLSIAENIAVFVTSGSSISLPIERSIYMFMYEDKDCCGWGHRHTLLWYPFNDNSGPNGSEGFLGVGRASGGPYKGPFSQSWPYAEMIVMNFFDPCENWDYTTTIFADVPASHPYYDYIEILYANGYTGGCSTTPLMFCPDVSMSRAQSAVFMLRGNFGNSYIPVTPTHIFKDNWKNSEWGEGWAESMYIEGLTAGCSPSPLKFCPDEILTNVQLAVFGLRLKHGISYPTPTPTGTVFADMTDTGFWGTGWAEQAYAEGLIPSCGTDVGSGKPLFCPNALVSRGFGASVIVKSKNLTMP